MPQSIRVLLSVLLLAALCLGFALPGLLASRASSAGTDADGGEPVVILDAGHGGEDGGAVSADGLQEKVVNLDLVFRIRDLLEASGVRVILTRDTDILLYDRTVDYRERKKALDLRARQKLAEETPGAFFVSIHMNAFPQKQVHGLQVWYSPNDARSAVLAGAVQEEVRSRLQPENTRKTKQAGSNIYLLYHLQQPAILIECGFLSNPAEAADLASDAYRQQLAQAIALGILAGVRSRGAAPNPAYGASFGEAP